MADPSLMRVVERILPIATYYTGIDAFMELRWVRSGRKWT